MGTLGIVMAIMMLVTNLFVILVVRLTMVSNFDYKAGMYLGVHIPADKKEDAEVTSVVNKTKNSLMYLTMLIWYYRLQYVVYVLWI